MPKQAGRVYEWERAAAAVQTHDTQFIERLGTVASAKISERAMFAAINAFRRGRDPWDAAVRIFDGIGDVLRDGMIYGRLKGIAAAQRRFPDIAIAAAATPNAYTRGIRILRQRLLMTNAQLVAIEQQIDRHVLRVMAEVKRAVRLKLTEAVADIHRRNLHVKAGAKELRKAWRRAGLGRGKPSQIEAIYRTQTQLTYAAGRAEVHAQPHVAEELWGYKYVTAGDDRVRDTHIGLDGVTLPKDDPFWNENTPPNGWQCRCHLIPIFTERKVVEAPSKVVVDGKEVRAGADEGFRFHPGRLFPSTGGPGS